MDWRLIIDKVRPGYLNMAIDESLLSNFNKTKTPVVRFYRWEKPTVSLGYFQNPEKHINFDNLIKNGVDWVRRPTGGRAVLHQHEITYSIIMPEKYRDLPVGITQSYQWLSAGLVKSLQLLGLNAHLSSEPPSQRKGITAACFDSPSWYELVVNGKKIVGSSQMRRNGVILQHGSILLDFDLQLFLESLKFSSEKSYELTKTALLEKCTSVNRELGRPVSIIEVQTALCSGFQKAFNISLNESFLTKTEEEIANHLVIHKYTTTQWNYNLEKKKATTT